MAEKKLAWPTGRNRIMKGQEELLGVAGCWAAVIESVLAFFTGVDKELSEINATFLEMSESKGVGGGGVKSFSNALKKFDIYGNSKKNPDGFVQQPQVFNFIKNSIDKDLPVLVGWSGTFGEQGEGWRHAGMLFGYDDSAPNTPKVFVMEPAKLNPLVDFYEQYFNTAQDLAVVLFAFGNLKGRVTDIYLTKRPSASAVGDQHFTHLVQNAASVSQATGGPRRGSR